MQIRRSRSVPAGPDAIAIAIAMGIHTMPVARGLILLVNTVRLDQLRAR
jgi:hypothetical protein